MSMRHDTEHKQAIEQAINDERMISSIVDKLTTEEIRFLDKLLCVVRENAAEKVVEDLINLFIDRGKFYVEDPQTFN